MIEINRNPSKKELVLFGLLLMLFCGVLGTLVTYRWQNPDWGRNVWVGGAVIALLYWSLPVLRRPVYLTWMYLAFPIGWTVSHLLLALIYYGVLTPIGVLLRCFRYDAMDRQLEPKASSYWIAQRPRGDAKSYFRQF